MKKIYTLFHNPIGSSIRREFKIYTLIQKLIGLKFTHLFTILLARQFGAKFKFTHTGSTISSTATKTSTAKPLYSIYIHFFLYLVSHRRYRNKHSRVVQRITTFPHN